MVRQDLTGSTMLSRRAVLPLKPNKLPEEIQTHPPLSISDGKIVLRQQGACCVLEDFSDKTAFFGMVDQIRAGWLSQPLILFENQ
jgi:hypothetical protein